MSVVQQREVSRAPVRAAVSERPWLLFVAVLLGGVMVGLDGTAFTIAAPFVARSLHSSLDGLQWIADSYLLALAVALLPAGALADKIGRRRTYVIGVLCFGVVSVAIYWAENTTELLVLRILQGFAAAALQPAALALLKSAFVPAKFEMVLGLWSGVNALAIGLGPVLAGVIVQSFSWPTVFVINGPIALLSTVLVYFAIKEVRGQVPSLRSGVRLALGSAPAKIAVVLITMAALSIFGLLFLLTLYLQNFLHMSPVMAGQWLLAPSCAVIVGAVAAGALVPKLGHWAPVRLGLLLIAVGLAALTTAGSERNFLAIGGPAVAIGVGVGLSMTMATQWLLSTAPARVSAISSAVQQITCQLGGVLGILLTGALLSGVVSRRLAGSTQGSALPAGRVDDIAQGRIPQPNTPLADVAHGAFLTGVHTSLVVLATIVALALSVSFLPRVRRIKVLTVG